MLKEYFQKELQKSAQEIDDLIENVKIETIESLYHYKDTHAHLKEIMHPMIHEANMINYTEMYNAEYSQQVQKIEEK